MCFESSALVTSVSLTAGVVCVRVPWSDQGFEDALGLTSVPINGVGLAVSVGFWLVMFKVCHFPEKGRQTEAERRKQSKEACEQLALLLVDLVSNLDIEWDFVCQCTNFRQLVGAKKGGAL